MNVPTLPITPDEATTPAHRHHHHPALIGSYAYLCLVSGELIYAHQPVGKVLWHRPTPL